MITAQSANQSPFQIIRYYLHIQCHAKLQLIVLDILGKVTLFCLQHNLDNTSLNDEPRIPTKDTGLHGIVILVNNSYCLCAKGLYIKHDTHYIDRVT